MAKKTKIESKEPLYPQIEAFLRSAEFDDLYFTDMLLAVNMDVSELVNKCSMLVTTSHAEYFIGLTFRVARVTIAVTPELEVSVVKEENKGFAASQRYRVSLDSVSTNWSVLTNYVTAGQVALRFMQNTITWAECKRALSDLVQGDLI